MPLTKQITACQIDIKQSDGTTSVSGYPKRVELYSGSITFRPYFLSGNAFDEALSGRLRTQLGGYRAGIQLAWEKLTNTANLANIVKDAKVSTYRPRVTFAPNAAAPTQNFNVIISDVSYSATIEATITRQPISVGFESQDVFAEIPDYLK